MLKPYWFLDSILNHILVTVFSNIQLIYLRIVFYNLSTIKLLTESEFDCHITEDVINHAKMREIELLYESELCEGFCIQE